MIMLDQIPELRRVQSASVTHVSEVGGLMSAPCINDAPCYCYYYYFERCKEVRIVAIP